MIQGIWALQTLREKLQKLASSEDALARVARNSAWMFSAKGIGAIASIVYLAILTRTLGPAGFGQFILIVSTVQILAALIRLQTWQTVIHYGAPMILQGRMKDFSRIAWEDFGVEIVGAIAALAALVFIVVPQSIAWGWNDQMEEGLIIYGLIIFLSLRSTTTGILRAHDRFRDAALGDAAIPLTRLIGAVALLFTGTSVTGFLIVWGLSETASAILQWFLVAQRKLIGKPGGKVMQRNYWSFLFATNASAVLTIVRERGAILVVGVFVGEATAGLFRLADQLAGSVNRITEIFSRPLFTEMSRLFAAGDLKRSRDLFFRSLRISALAGVPIMIGLVLLGWPLIYLMSGKEFLPAYPLLLILGASSILGLASLGLEPLLQAAGRAGQSFFSKLAGLFFTGLFLFLWLGPDGVSGASWAILAGSVLSLLVMMYLTLRLLAKSRDKGAGKRARDGSEKDV